MSSVWLQSFNFPDRFIRHRNFLGELDQEVVGREADFSWVLMKRGTGGGQRRIGLRSTNFPKHYLRHKSFRVVLEEPNGPTDDQWKRDSTFIVVRGLADPNGMSFQASNLFPAHYVRHRNFQLFVEPGDSPNLVADATFYQST